MSYKLTYFDATGRAELARYLFALAGQSYIDERISQEQFKARKPDLIFGTMPVLAINDKSYAQGNAIARYLANKYGLAGKTDEEKLRADMIVECLRGDTLAPIMKYIFFAQGEDEKKKAREEMVEKWNFFMEKFETLVLGEKTVLASGLSWADVALFNFGTDFAKIANLTVPDKCAKVKAIIANVGAQSKIQEWITKRP